jgi:propionate CoA-transferase
MQVIDADPAAGLVRSGQTITVSGLVGNLVAEHVLQALERRFLETGQPDGLTEIHPWLYGGPDGTGLTALPTRASCAGSSAARSSSPCCRRRPRSTG